MASDLISREALLAEYDRVHVGEPGRARKLIAEAPAVDAVEVVRCKDCKHFYQDFGKEYKGDCGELSGLISGVYADDYCSYGVRRKKKDAVD